MDYGSLNVARAAINFNGQWYVAKGLFYDNGKQSKENYFVIAEKTDSTGRLVEFRVKLDTVDGMKEVIFYMP